ncbi:MAG: uL15m family ribosomal protein, partial [Natronomonas sp.]
KSGFKRPQKTRRDTETVNLRELDEDIAVLAADGVAEESGDGYTIDARDIVEDGYEADVVKVLGAGQVYNELEVVADAFSEDAVAALDAAGGEAVLSERGEELEAEKDTTDEDNEEA